MFSCAHACHPVFKHRIEICRRRPHHNPDLTSAVFISSLSQMSSAVRHPWLIKWYMAGSSLTSNSSGKWAGIGTVSNGFRSIWGVGLFGGESGFGSLGKQSSAHMYNKHRKEGCKVHTQKGHALDTDKCTSSIKQCSCHQSTATALQTSRHCGCDASVEQSLLLISSSVISSRRALVLLRASFRLDFANALERRRLWWSFVLVGVPCTVMSVSYFRSLSAHGDKAQQYENGTR